MRSEESIQNLWQSAHIIHSTARQVDENRRLVQKVQNLICNVLVLLIVMVALRPLVAISTLDPRKQEGYSQKNLHFSWLERVAHLR